MRWNTDMPTQQSTQANTQTQQYQSVKVLIVDDQRVAAGMLKNVLKNIGVKDIHISLTYDDAINNCRQHAYDILFIDYHLDGLLNGSELITLLRRRKYLSSHCGIIMISGDHSTEVILTSLSIDPNSFITKPITAEMVERNLSATLHDRSLRAPIYDAMINDGIAQAISVCKQQLKKTGYNKKLEGLLLDLMLQDNQWQQAKKYTDILQQHNPSPALSLIKARYEHHQGNLSTAISILEKQIASSPLNIDLYDYLACYLKENNQYYDALDVARNALKLTPSISHRALKVAELAADLDKTEILTAAGNTLASHLPIIDVEWIICFAEYMAIFEQAYFKHHSAAFRRQLKQQLAIIDKKAHSRVLPIQQPFLTSYGHIIMARLALGNSQTLKAKRRLLIGLSTYFDHISSMPSVMLADALPQLVHLGETSLIEEFNQVLSNRNRFDGHSTSRLQDIQSNTILVEAIQRLEIQLANAHLQLQHNPAKAMVIYEAILNDYPYCSEANLGCLDCITRLNLTEDKKLKHSLQAIASMPLPDHLAQWRERLFEMMTTQQATPQQMRAVLPYKKRTQLFVVPYSRPA